MAASFEASDGAKPPSSPWPVEKPRSCSSAAQRVEHLGPRPQRLAEGIEADGHDHELLEVRGVQGVLAAVEDVEHRHGQGAGTDTTQVAVQRLVGGRGRGMGDGQGHAQDGVRTQLALVGRAVEVQQPGVDARLVGDVLAQQVGRDEVDDVLDRGQDALAADSGPCRHPAARPPRGHRWRHPTGPPRDPPSRRR